MKGSCLILQSGGPTSVINSSLLGVITASLKSKKITNVLGSLNGINGVLNDNVIDLSKESKKELKKLCHTPSAILGSARHILPNDFKNDIYDKLISQFKKYNIRYIFVIGGNDSMDSANKLHLSCDLRNYKCNVVGIPKTIDNDLINIDHTPGYGSACKFIATTIAEIKEDINCYKNGRVTIVETMGRDAGWLAASSKLACLSNDGADLIYLPEVAFNLDNFLNKTKELYGKNKKVLVVVSEGIKDENNEYILNKYSSNTSSDVFGHIQLGGVGYILANIVNQKLNIPTRSVELNLPQRCASHCASLTDIKEAYNCGKTAVFFASKGLSNIMISMKRKDNKKYKVEYTFTSLDSVANAIKYFPTKWIIDGCNISNEYISYALPLIKSKNKTDLPSFAKLKKINGNSS